MNIQIIPADFAQAKAILRDAILKETADLRNRETLRNPEIVKS